jgi:hypothetical protein
MKIGYIETFPLLGKDRWQKIPLENEVDVNIPLDATDEEIEEVMKKVRRIQYALKKQVQSFFYESNAAAEKQMGTQVVDAVEKITITQVADLIKEINFCKDAATLEKTYKIIAKTDPDLQDAYDKKLKSFQ